MNITGMFGSNCTMNTSTPSDPELRIKYSDLATIAQWGTPPASGTDSAEKWLAAIVLKAKSHLATITDESNDISIDDPFKAFSTRNSVDKVGFSYNLTIYQPDLNGTKPDPDSV